MAARLAKTLFLYWFPVGLWAAFIFYLSTITGDQLPPLPVSQFDKVIHAAEFGILGLLFFRAFFVSWPERPPVFYFSLTVLAGVFYGMSDEWHQRFVPGRVCDIFDLLADTFGILLFLFLATILQKLFDKPAVLR